MAEFNFGEDLIRVHKFITRGLRVSAEYSGEGGLPNPDLASGFDRYVRALIAVLHVHHRGEDGIAWPFLQERMPEAPYESLIAQHEVMAEALSVADGARERGDMGALHEQLTAIDRLWQDHIRIEEYAFSVEATEQALTAHEHRQLTSRLVRHAQLHSRPIPLVIAFTLYNLSPEDRAEMATTVPAVVRRFLLPVVWKRAWEPMKPFLLT